MFHRPSWQVRWSYDGDLLGTTAVSTPQSFDEHLRVTTGTYIGGAVLGVITGGFLTYVACSIFEAGSPLREISTVVVASLNAALNIRRAHRAACRQKAFDEVSESLGILDASDVAEEVELRLGQLLGHVESFELHEARKKAFGDAEIVLGEVEWRGEQTDANRRAMVYRRTVWYFEDQGRNLPAFVLKPDSWILVAALDVSLAEKIDFSDRPEFTKSYQVSADDANAVRHLFSHKLVDFLEQHPGLEVLARKERLAVFRSGGLVPAGEIDHFIETAMLVARLIGMAEKSTGPVAPLAAPVPEQAAPPVVPPRWTQASSRVYAEQQYRYDVQQLLGQPPPRTIPWRIAQRHQGCITVLLMLWSCGFLLGGIGLVLQSLSSSDPETRFIACGMGLGFVLIGSTVFFFPGDTEKSCDGY